jgi:hypothetical protein
MKHARIWITAMIGTLVGSVSAEPLVYEGTDGIGKGKHLVFVANDHEYRSEESSPLLAKILAKHHGFKCTVLFGLNEDGTIGSGVVDLPGLEALKDADGLFFFTRFMRLSDEQCDLLVDYFERGGPAVGVRTSTHCFNGVKGKWAKLNFNYGGDDYRGGLGEQVFGNTWNKQRGQSHYGSNHAMGCTITPVDSAKEHPIMRGVNKIHAYSGAYKSQPPSGATELLQVQVLNTFGPSDDVNAERPIVNAGWTRDSYVAPSGVKKNARVVYASYGASEDLLSEGGRRFLVNAMLWSIGLEGKITADLDVSIPGKFSPSPYSSGAFYRTGVKPADLAGWDSEVMPSSAPMAKVDDPNSARRSLRVLANRTELKNALVAKYPEIWGPDAKLPPAPAKKKKTPKKKK